MMVMLLLPNEPMWLVILACALLTTWLPPCQNIQKMLSRMRPMPAFLFREAIFVCRESWRMAMTPNESSSGTAGDGHGGAQKKESK